MRFAYDVAVHGKRILLVGTKKQAQRIIREVAEATGQPVVTYRWLGGTLTNNATIRLRIKRMREIEAMEKDGSLAALPKKEVASLRRELTKLHRNLLGIGDMAELPSALFVVDVNREAIAVAEARKLGIPVIAIVDTNCDPDPIEYVIPGNDDAIRAIQLVARSLAGTINRANAEYARVAAEETKKREAEEADARKKSEEAESARAKARKKAEESKPVRPRAKKIAEVTADGTPAKTKTAAEVAGDETAAEASPADGVPPTAEPAADTKAAAPDIAATEAKPAVQDAEVHPND
jgi:small subunit ribosomal protein S2